jgi:ADP-heptose:LPS heptosyltransferase
VKILIIRFSSIGDLVLTTPVFRCLVLQKGAEVQLLTKTNMAGVLSNNPYIKKIHRYEDSDCLQQLKNEQFDQVVDLHNNIRSMRIKFALGRPTTAVNKLNFEKWLYVKTGINRLPDVHIVDRYMDTVRHLGVTYDGQGLDYPIPDAVQHQVDVEILQSVDNQPFVVFVLGAAHATKQVPQMLWEAIGVQLNRPIILIGGKSEITIGEKVQKALENKNKIVLNYCGNSTLLQSAAIIRRAACIVTPDTGMMHIAAALNRPIVAIWGNTVPQFGMYPFHPDNGNISINIEVHGLHCRPCSKIGYDRCPKGHFDCMQKQDPQLIVTSILELIN